MIKKYIKKPTPVEAVCWSGDNKAEIQKFVRRLLDEHSATRSLILPNYDGYAVVKIGDYIVKNPFGAFDLCKAEEFEKNYEEAKDDGE